jgi:hypothetical protein
MNDHQTMESLTNACYDYLVDKGPDKAALFFGKNARLAVTQARERAEAKQRAEAKKAEAEQGGGCSETGI